MSSNKEGNFLGNLLKLGIVMLVLGAVTQFVWFVGVYLPKEIVAQVVSEYTGVVFMVLGFIFILICVYWEAS